MMVGRWVSFWDWLFLGAMLNFRGVAIQKRVGRIRSANAGRLAWFLWQIPWGDQNQSSTGQIFLRKAAKSPTYFGLIILSLFCYLPTSQAWCRDFWHKEVLPRAKDAQLAVVLWRLCKVTSQKPQKMMWFDKSLFFQQFSLRVFGRWGCHLGRTEKEGRQWKAKGISPP